MRLKHRLIVDAFIVVASIAAAVVLAESGVIATFLTSTKQLEIVGSFIAGMFFTSLFTTAPAITTLGELARVNSLPLVAISGAAGAVIGDLIIFRFIRDRLSEHLMELLKHEHKGKRFRALLRMRYFRWFTFFLGGLVIASPLPDELGIGLLGFTRTKTLLFVTISYTFNFLGILLLGSVARAL